MTRRHSIFTGTRGIPFFTPLITNVQGLIGLGLCLLFAGLGGCGTETTAEQRPPQRFEVTPTGVTRGGADSASDRGAAASRRRRPAAEPADSGADDAQAADAGEAGPTAAPTAAPPDVVRRHITNHARALRSAPLAPAAPDADGTIRWTGPNESAATGGSDGAGPAVEPRAARSRTAQPRQIDPDRALAVAEPARAGSPAAGPPAAAPGPEEVKPAQPAPSAPAAKPEAEPAPSVANVGATVAKPLPAPALATKEPKPDSLSAPASPLSHEPIFSSAHVGADSTASADPDVQIHLAEQKIRDYPSDLSAHFDYQMARFLRDEPVPDLESMGRLSNEDREVLTALMDGITNFRNALRADKNMLPSQTIKPVLDMADRMRGSAELTIPTIAVCSKVLNFGVYDPMPSNLKAGIDNPLILYCEVQNFSSQHNDKGMWETKLSQEAVLYTETGLGVWRDKSDIPVDLSRNRRHDFFVVKKITVPKTLGVGRYILKVTIVDEQVKRVAENSIPLQILAQ